MDDYLSGNFFMVKIQLFFIATVLSFLNSSLNATNPAVLSSFSAITQNPIWMEIKNQTSFFENCTAKSIAKITFEEWLTFFKILIHFTIEELRDHEFCLMTTKDFCDTCFSYKERAPLKRFFFPILGYFNSSIAFLEYLQTQWNSRIPGTGFILDSKCSDIVCNKYCELKKDLNKYCATQLISIRMPRYKSLIYNFEENILLIIEKLLAESRNNIKNIEINVRATYKAINKLKGDEITNFSQSDGSNNDDDQVYEIIN